MTSAANQSPHDHSGQAGGHGAGHKHDHHGHGHGHHQAVTADSERRVFWVMLLTCGFMIVQAVGGVLSGSLALLADSGHMLSDSAALGLAWLAFRLSRRSPDSERSYGYHRFQILAAFVNGLTLFLIAGWIVFEAVERVLAPVPVLGFPMLAVAIVGLLVNLAGFLILNRGDRENVNMRGALLHVVGDLLGSAAAIAAAGVILLTGWTPIDPILSVFVALLILKSAYGLVRNSGHILMEGTPAGVDPGLLRADLSDAVAGVRDVHHVHVWSLTAERKLVTLHVRLDPDADPQTVLAALKTRLRERFGIDHCTVQIDPAETCPDDQRLDHGHGSHGAASRPHHCREGDHRERAPGFARGRPSRSPAYRQEARLLSSCRAAEA